MTCPSPCELCEAEGGQVRKRYPPCPNPYQERAAHYIRRIVDKWGLHPYDINNGRCDEFADALVESLGAGEVIDLGDNHPHYCVEYEGRFYDAEEPYGVRSPDYLPLCVRARRR